VIVVTEASDNLEDLLAQITEDNIRPEIDFGEPVGKEIWLWDSQTNLNL
jgi:antitoxin component of MazEF toxin-antitoxin module